jgi:hypothetical protein
VILVVVAIGTFAVRRRTTEPEPGADTEPDAGPDVADDEALH